MASYAAVEMQLITIFHQKEETKPTEGYKTLPTEGYTLQWVKQMKE